MAVGFVAGGLSLAAARDALATPSAKLVYVRGPDTAACPDEDQLRRAVATRIGYDPFFASAPKTVIAQVSRARAGYRGKVQITGALHARSGRAGALSAVCGSTRAASGLGQASTGDVAHRHAA